MSDAQTILYQPFDELKSKVGECFEIFERERSARIRAENDNRQKDAFLAIVAHELRNPLQSIVGWLELLRCETLEEPTGRRAIEAINRGVRLQTKIIEDLLDVYRITNGKLQLNLCETEIAPLIEGVLGDINNLVEAKRISIEASLAPDLGMLTADTARLEQVLWNLLSNGIKFTPPDGKIWVKAGRTRSGVEISIIDNGRGIESELLPRIFDPFIQSAPFSGGRENGIGLGLSIVRQIVELHGGNIRAESAGCEQGAKFTVRLPCVAPTFAPETSQIPVKKTAFDRLF